MFITVRTCSCGKTQLGVHCTKTHNFWCRECAPMLYAKTSNTEFNN